MESLLAFPFSISARNKQVAGAAQRSGASSICTCAQTQAVCPFLIVQQQHHAVLYVVLMFNVALILK